MTTTWLPKTHVMWWGLLGLAGTLWMSVGLLLFSNAFLCIVQVSPNLIALLLASDGAVTFAAAFRYGHASRSILIMKACMFLGTAIVVYATRGQSSMAVGLLVGGFLVIHAGWQSLNAISTRSADWRQTIAFAAIELLLGAWALVDYPDVGTLGSDVSLLIMNSACQLIMAAVRRWQQRGRKISLPRPACS